MTLHPRFLTGNILTELKIVIIIIIPLPFYKYKTQKSFNFDVILIYFEVKMTW